MKKIHRFISEYSITDTNEVHGISGEVSRQIRSVLKIKPGERIVFLSGKGPGVEIELTDLEEEVKGKVIRTFDVEGEVEERCTMYVAILKRDLFELVVQKLTELGVTEIIPLITDRTIKLGLKKDRLQSIAKEAVELSGRSVVPAIHEPISFDEAMKNRSQNVHHVFFQKGVRKFSRKVLGPKKMAGWVGPEGGWSEREEELAKKNGLELVSLTDTILRGETAAIVGAYTLITG